MEKNNSTLMMRSGNRSVYATGKLASTITIGVVAMLLMVGIAALVEAGNNCINKKNLNQ